MIELVEEDLPTGARIRVIGVGGGGGNAINTMIASGLTGVEFIAMNTDQQDLQRSLAGHRFQLGAQLTKGLGAGANPEVGREAALEDRDRIAELVVGADMVFIKPAMMYQDIIYRIKERYKIPVWAYQVSGEYSMIKSFEASCGYRNSELIMESLISLKRSGSDIIITYAACEVASLLLK